MNNVKNYMYIHTSSSGVDLSGGINIIYYIYMHTDSLGVDLSGGTNITPQNMQDLEYIP